MSGFVFYERRKNQFIALVSVVYPLKWILLPSYYEVSKRK